MGGVQVQITNQDTGEDRTAVSQDNGTYIIPQLPPGRYSVTVEKQRFAKETQSGILRWFRLKLRTMRCILIWVSVTLTYSNSIRPDTVTLQRSISMPIT